MARALSLQVEQVGGVRLLDVRLVGTRMGEAGAVAAQLTLRRAEDRRPACQGMRISDDDVRVVLADRGVRRVVTAADTNCSRSGTTTLLSRPQQR